MLPEDATNSLLKLYDSYLNEIVLQTSANGMTTHRSTRGSFSTSQAFEALQLARKAKSLDEFLSHLRLIDYQEDILKLEIGVRLSDIAETSVHWDSDKFMEAIPELKRSQANRLSKYLQRNHADRMKRRARALNRIASRLSVGNGEGDLEEEHCRENTEKVSEG